MPMAWRVCGRCSKPYLSKRSNSKTCGATCRKARQRFMQAVRAKLEAELIECRYCGMKDASKVKCGVCGGTRTSLSNAVQDDDNVCQTTEG